MDENIQKQGELKIYRKREKKKIHRRMEI